MGRLDPFRRFRKIETGEPKGVGIASDSVKVKQMLRRYDDIRSRIGDPIRWWDDNGVPRYCDFSPGNVACTMLSPLSLKSAAKHAANGFASLLPSIASRYAKSATGTHCPRPAALALSVMATPFPLSRHRRMRRQHDEL